MTSADILRGFFTAVIALAFTINVYYRHSIESDTAIGEENRQRYLPYLPSTLLIWFLLAVYVMFILATDIRTASHYMLGTCFGIFLHICIYYAILILLMPLLRRFVSARACAELWLIPNYLYLTFQSGFLPESPRWVLTISKEPLMVIVAVWFAGFAAVLIWKSISHILFRHSILSGAYDETDKAILDIWRSEQNFSRIKKADFRLVRSPHVETPLSIGFFRRSIRVVLPEKHYSHDELRLIFRHELVHIGREDANNKFFMVFCTAMCWFNPLMWFAMKKSAEDLELSCDETVLSGAHEHQRKSYADLILRTAGDDRGYTTCLSASASSLRYRLKNIVKPGRRLVGGILVGVVFFALFMSCGYVTLAYDRQTGAESIFGGMELSQFELRQVSSHVDGRGYEVYDCADSEKLLEYLSSLEFYSLTGMYDLTEEEVLYVNIDGPHGVSVIRLSETGLKISRLYDTDRYDGESRTSHYYLAAPLDTAFFDSILSVTENDESEDVIYVPEMTIYFDEKVNTDGKLMHAGKNITTVRVSGEEQDPDEWRYQDDPGSGTVVGYIPDKAKLHFSHEPLMDYIVEVADLDGNILYHKDRSELEDDVIILEPHSAQYKVISSFYVGQDTEFDMEFSFVIKSE